MALKVYPTLPGLTFPVLRMTEFDTDIQTSSNKYETALPNMVNPLWSWQLTYDFLRDFAYGSFTISELRTILDFFLFQGGRAGRFLFLDPDDNFVGPAMVSGSPNVPMAQLQVVTDGTNYYSPLQRTLGGLFYEDITDLNTSGTGSTPAFYKNGTLAVEGIGSGQYQIDGPGLALPGASFMGLYLNWGATNPAAPVTGEFSFYFRARFEMDSQDMEKFAQAYWTIGGSESQKGSGQIKLIQSRPNPL